MRLSRLCAILLLCAGGGSTVTYHEEMTVNGVEFWAEYDLVDVAIVGTCPGESVDGSLTLVNGQSTAD